MGSETIARRNREILELHQHGLTAASIAAKYGLTVHATRQAIHNEKRKKGIVTRKRRSCAKEMARKIRESLAQQEVSRADEGSPQTGEKRGRIKAVVSDLRAICQRYADLMEVKVLFRFINTICRNNNIPIQEK